MAVSFLSPEQCKTWEKSGKQEFLKFINGVGDRSVLSSLGNRDFRQAIYDLCQHVIKGNLRVEQAIHVFHDLKTFDCDALLKSRLDHETYKQQKFNLLREESEGYSKLVAELNQEITYKITPAVMLQNIKSLIGCFNLDPNRVIDVLLESFENRPEVEDFYIPLIQSYVQDNETLCHCLGLKFQFFKDDETPSSLFKLAAILLKNDLVHLETLYPHLHPVDSVILEYSKKEMADAKAYARKLMVINLADKSDEKKKEEEEVKIDVRVNNQKLGLVEALLCIGAWEKSKCILDWLPEFFATTHKPVASALCALIHTVMDPVYRTSSGMTSKLVSKWPPIEELGGSVPRATSFQEVNTLVFPMVAYLGPYISCDPILLMKLIRLSKQYMIKGSLSPEDAPTYYGLLNVIDEALLPSVSFLSYRMYGNWKNELYISHPALIRVKADCLEKSKYIMKRLAKENVKISGRQLGKLSHSNPGVLFEYILRQVEKYDNLIGPVWRLLLAASKYTVEQTGLVQYVTNQLKAGRSTDLLLMQEIVQKMAGIEVSEEITADQLDAMSGGELLRQEGGYFTQVRNMKKSSSRLKDTMLEHDLALSLCLLISQQRDSVIFKEATRHLKHYGKLYDQCQDTLVQFGSFLSMQLSTEEFVKRLPPIHKMVTEFHVPPDAAFFLSRPLYSYDINAKYDELRKAERAEKDKKDKLSTSAKSHILCDVLGAIHLKDEEKRQTEHVQRITARLKAQRDQWFVSRATKNETITQFLQLCIFPRCCFTASDAVYCAEFIHILHNLKTPNFSTLICYDRIFCDITYTVSSCTENEAQRYGRFLCAALDTVMRWHSSKEFYEKECGAYPGFVTVFRKGENSNQKADQLDYENYRHVCHKWHFRITKAMVTCIESSNYIQIRNALIVLTKILPHYPRIVQFGSPLERRVDRLKQEEKEKRPDLFALAMGRRQQLQQPRPAPLCQETLEKARSEEKGRDSPVDAKKSNSSTATEKKEVTLASSKASGSKDKKEKEKSEKLAEPDKARSEDKMDKSKDDKATRKDEKGIKAKEEKIDTHKVKIKREDKSDIVTPLKLKVKQEKVEPPEESENLRSDRKEKGKEKKGEKERLKVKVEKDGDEPKGKDVRDKEEKLRAKLERMKEETKDRHEKEGRKEKHDRKLKRSYSPEEAAKEVMYRDHRDAEAASNSSHGSHRQTPEASPRRAEERDTKRRKTEAIASTSKVSIGDEYSPLMEVTTNLPLSSSDGVKVVTMEMMKAPAAT
ncbi:LOW QUALITY PROTEIN: THOC2-like protein [Mya arenaria]|uniref:THO complex subunit 2 n=1 Tax=Mya arenaria TaxID=6604 RepID=A0ABY7DPU1_MYAAR|nr:LOW QUALITY PROTEIN: THOC2-like protein [Mya arenaria]